MQSDVIFGKLKVLVAFRVFFVSILLGAFFVLQLEYKIFPYPKFVLLLIPVIYCLNIVYLLLIKQRSINPILLAYIQLVLDVFMEIALIMATGGIESWFTFTLLLTVISASIVIGKKAGYIMATLAGIMYGVVIDFQYYQIIPIGFSRDLAEKDFLYNIVINLLAVYLIAYLIGYLSEGLERTRISLDEKSLNLRELSHFHTDVIENIPSGLFSTDLDGSLRLFNRAAEQITGIQREEIVRFKINEIFSFVKLPISPDRYRGTIETSEGKKKIGMSISEHRNQDGQIVGYIGTFQDLTDIVRLENEIKKREKFAAIGELSANIAHEIRNPLASIKGSIEMIKEGRLKNQGMDRLMEIALNEITRLNNIITNFLDYSNPKPLSFHKCDIGDLLTSTITLLQSSVAEATNIEFNIDCEDALYCVIDEAKLSQVLWNLLTNAVESIEKEGLISVRALKKGNSVKIEITDTGQGIKKENIERIFYPFYTTKKEGTGLGLAIAYRIVDDHNGSIVVSSREGKSTIFTIKIPVERQSGDERKSLLQQYSL